MGIRTGQHSELHLQWAERRWMRRMAVPAGVLAFTLVAFAMGFPWFDPTQGWFQRAETTIAWLGAAGVIGLCAYEIVGAVRDRRTVLAAGSDRSDERYNAVVAIGFAAEKSGRTAEALTGYLHAAQIADTGELGRQTWSEATLAAADVAYTTANYDLASALHRGVSDTEPVPDGIEQIEWGQHAADALAEDDLKNAVAGYLQAAEIGANDYPARAVTALIYAAYLLVDSDRPALAAKIAAAAQHLLSEVDYRTAGAWWMLQSHIHCTRGGYSAAREALASARALFDEANPADTAFLALIDAHSLRIPRETPS